MTIVCSLCGWAHTRSECPRESKTASRSSAESGHMTYDAPLSCAACGREQPDDTQPRETAQEPLGWPSREVIAREIRRAMLDNPTDESFNKRAEERERIANDAADVILTRFAACRTPADSEEEYERVIDNLNEKLLQALKQVDLLEKNGRIQGKLLADTARERDQLAGVVEGLRGKMAEINEIVHTPTKETGFRSANTHFQSDFDRIRILSKPDSSTLPEGK